VTIVTPGAFVGMELARTAADGAVRRRMGALGVRMLTEHRLVRWHGNGVTVRSFLTGEEEVIPASGLVMATTNRALIPSPRRFRARSCTGSAMRRTPAGGLCLPRGAQAGKINGLWAFRES
jgi:hypothetical protein